MSNGKFDTITHKENRCTPYVSEEITNNNSCYTNDGFIPDDTKITKEESSFHGTQTSYPKCDPSENLVVQQPLGIFHMYMDESKDGRCMSYDVQKPDSDLVLYMSPLSTDDQPYYSRHPPSDDRQTFCTCHQDTVCQSCLNIRFSQNGKKLFKEEETNFQNVDDNLSLVTFYGLRCCLL